MNKISGKEVKRTMKEKKPRPVKEKKATPAKENKLNERWAKTQEVFRIIGRVFYIIGRILFHMRKIFLTLPVLWLAFKVYNYAKELLPDTVGVWLLENGDYAFSLGVDAALISCLAVTAACLVLMYLSRRTILPWIISIFTLVLPVMLVLTNMYPS